MSDPSPTGSSTTPSAQQAIQELQQLINLEVQLDVNAAIRGEVMEEALERSLDHIPEPPAQTKDATEASTTTFPASLPDGEKKQHADLQQEPEVSVGQLMRSEEGGVGPFRDEKKPHVVASDDDEGDDEDAEGEIETEMDDEDVDGNTGAGGYNFETGQYQPHSQAGMEVGGGQQYQQPYGGAYDNAEAVQREGGGNAAAQPLVSGYAFIDQVNNQRPGSAIPGSNDSDSNTSSPGSNSTPAATASQAEASKDTSEQVQEQAPQRDAQAEDHPGSQGRNNRPESRDIVEVDQDPQGRRSASPVRRPRRAPGQQRRSPSYSMDAPPAPVPSNGVTSPTKRERRPSHPSLPNKPAPTSYSQQFDFSAVSFPEGLSEDSPSVRKHAALVQAWVDSLSPLHSSASRTAQTLHALFEAARADGDVEDARAWFELFFKENPTATGPLMTLINLELANGNFPQVVASYEKALRGLGGVVGAVPGVEIWKSYLHYIRRQNPIPAPGSTNASMADSVRETIRKAYELALDRTGLDIDAGDIWKEYIAFLGEKATTSTWEASQQTDAVRKAYQTVVGIPLANVESIWKEYDQFENKLNKATAKKFLAERSPYYMTARTVLRDLKAHLEPLVPLEIPPRPTWVESDRLLANSWKRYLKWEEGNPLDIEDAPALQARIGYAFRKCLTQMRFFPEIWHQASHYFASIGKSDEVANYLKVGLEANPSSFLLSFAYAELEETNKNLSACRTTFDNLLKHHGQAIERTKASIEAEVAKAQGPEIDIGGEDQAQTDDDTDMDVVEVSANRRKFEERESQGTAVREKRAKELDDMIWGAGLIWTMYIRFARRSEGLKSARGVFSAARKSPYVSWQVYESSAYMEYYCNKDANVATKIFELGLKAFPNSADFALKFLQFLLQINDDSNARALFERLVANKFPADKARPIWDAWLRHEYMFGDLTSGQKLEARLAEVYPNDAPLKRFAAKYSYSGNDQIAIRDLGFGQKAPAEPPVGPRSTQVPKRALPDEISPSKQLRRLGGDRDRSRDQYRPEPSAPKRQRAVSPPPISRWGAHADQRRREPSPQARPRPVAQRPPPQAEQLDPSGLPKAIVWFLGNLPNARSFDGPIFTAEDLMPVLATISLPNGGGGQRRLPSRG